MRGCSRYNTITKLLREEIIEWMLSQPNAKPSCVSSDAVTVLDKYSNQREFLPKTVNGDFR